jgi:hypothetical protein
VRGDARGGRAQLHSRVEISALLGEFLGIVVMPAAVTFEVASLLMEFGVALFELALTGCDLLALLLVCTNELGLQGSTFGFEALSMRIAFASLLLVPISAVVGDVRLELPHALP